MRKSQLAWMVATACFLAACATGVDSQDGLPSGDDSGAGVETSSGGGHDGSSSSGGRDSAAVTQDTGTTDPDSGSTGDDASAWDDGSSTQDSATAQDTGAVVPDTGTGQDTGTTSGGVCGSAAKYGVEAAAEVLSGTITFCFSGVCAAGKCCYEQASPGNVCVAE